MAIRDALNQKPGLSMVIGIGVVVIGAALIAYQLTAMRGPGRHIPSAYFTTDDGATLFAESSTMRAPFDHDGKPAVRAYVYKCDGKQFVGYLERYTPQAKKILDEVDYASKHNTPADGPPKNLGLAPGAERNGRQVKKPGDKEWIGATTPAGTRLTTIDKGPPGTTGVPVSDLP